LLLEQGISEIYIFMKREERAVKKTHLLREGKGATCLLLSNVKNSSTLQKKRSMKINGLASLT
jgi:hypothetical protein